MSELHLNISCPGSHLNNFSYAGADDNILCKASLIKAHTDASYCSLSVNFDLKNGEKFLVKYFEFVPEMMKNVDCSNSN